MMSVSSLDGHLCCSNLLYLHEKPVSEVGSNKSRTSSHQNFLSFAVTEVRDLRVSHAHLARVSWGHHATSSTAGTPLIDVSAFWKKKRAWILSCFSIYLGCTHKKVYVRNAPASRALIWVSSCSTLASRSLLSSPPHTPTRPSANRATTNPGFLKDRNILSWLFVSNVQDLEKALLTAFWITLFLRKSLHLPIAKC